MELTFALLAGAADVSQQTGLVIINGGLDSINIDRGTRSFAVVAKFDCPRSEVGNKHKLTLQLHDPEGGITSINEGFELKVPDVPEDAMGAALLFVANVNISEPIAGAHRVDLLLDGSTIKKIPFYINRSIQKKEVANVS